MSVGMIDGMTVKITISLPDELAEVARRAVEAGEAESVSAYIAACIEAYQEGPTLDELLAQWEAENPPSEETIRWVEGVARELGWIDEADAPQPRSGDDSADPPL